MADQFCLYGHVVESTQTGYPTQYIRYHNVSNKELIHKIWQLGCSQSATPATSESHGATSYNVHNVFWLCPLLAYRRA